jgi:catechol 2,3-dioxygenase-like lactoylglutathione lyase family enzyme
MLNDCRLVAFLATAKPEAARDFYGTTLGLALIEDGSHALVFDCGEGRLRIQKLQTVSPPPGTALGWQVSDIATEMKALVSRGVRFERYEGMGQDEAGVWTPPGTDSRVAWFKDPDGNLLSLTQLD